MRRRRCSACRRASRAAAARASSRSAPPWRRADQPTCLLGLEIRADSTAPARLPAWRSARPAFAAGPARSSGPSRSSPAAARPRRGHARSRPPAPPPAGRASGLRRLSPGGLRARAAPGPRPGRSGPRPCRRAGAGSPGVRRAGRCSASSCLQQGLVVAPGLVVLAPEHARCARRRRPAGPARARRRSPGRLRSRSRRPARPCRRRPRANGASGPVRPRAAHRGPGALRVSNSPRPGGVKAKSSASRSSTASPVMRPSGPTSSASWRWLNALRSRQRAPLRSNSIDDLRAHVLPIGQHGLGHLAGDPVPLEQHGPQGRQHGRFSGLVVAHDDTQAVADARR